jgi:hypothetical protein
MNPEEMGREKHRREANAEKIKDKQLLVEDKRHDKAITHIWKMYEKRRDQARRWFVTTEPTKKRSKR